MQWEKDGSDFAVATVFKALAGFFPLLLDIKLFKIFC